MQLVVQVNMGREHSGHVTANSGFRFIHHKIIITLKLRVNYFVDL